MNLKGPFQHDTDRFFSIHQLLCLAALIFFSILKVSDETIKEYLVKYADARMRLAAYFQLKTVLAPCIESLLILDKACYLLEQVTRLVLL